MSRVQHGWILGLLLLACRQSPPSGPSTAAAPDAAPACAHHANHAGHAAPPAATAPLPDTSVFHLDSAWTTQTEAPFRFASLRGSPTVVLMFYGSCQAVCPILLGDVLRVEAALSPAARARTRFVLITLDPTVDTAPRLRALAAERGMDPSRWTLLRGQDADIRTVATVLGVQYSRLDTGEFTHSNTITLLSPEGLVVERIEGLRQPVEPMARAVEGHVR